MITRRRAHGIQFSRVDGSGTSEEPVLVRSGVIAWLLMSMTKTSPVLSLPIWLTTIVAIFVERVRSS